MENKFANLLLAAQNALLGEIMPSLRAVAVDWEDNTIIVYFYNDGEISEELWDDFSCVASEIIAHFGKATIDEKIIQLNYPQKIPKHEYLAYLRKEPPIAN